MTVRMSTEARTKVLGTESFKDRFDYCWLRIFSGSQPSSADSEESGDLMMEMSERMSATFDSSTTFTVSGDQTGIFAEGRTLRAYVGMAADYSSSTKFIVSGDKTGTFTTDLSIKADCGSDGTKTATVEVATYSSDTSNTTVELNESVLTDNLTDVLWAETLTVDSSSYSDPDTTVTVVEDVLTDHLSEVMYGIRLGTAADAVIPKHADANIKAMGKRNGNGGWWRLYPNGLDTGADVECMDGSYGTSGDMQVLTSTIQAGAESSISTFKLSLPES